MARESFGTLVASASKAWRALFYQTYYEVAEQWEFLATVAPSNTKTVNYQFLGAVPVMREWLGDKQRRKLMGFEYTITDKSWEATLEVDRDHFEDDVLGIYNARVQELGQEARWAPGREVMKLIRDGHATACYDGQYFFDTDHSEGDSGTQSNIIDGTASSGSGGYSISEIKDDFVSAAERMMSFLNDRGEPMLGLFPDTVVVPTEIWGNVFEFAHANLISNTTNVFGPKVQRLVHNPYLTDVNNWYVFCTSRPVKPFIFQPRWTRPRFVSQTDPTSDAVFNTKTFAYSAEHRFNVGYGPWQLGIKIANTGSYT